MKRIICLFLLSICSSIIAREEIVTKNYREKHFTIIIPSYNNERWYKSNLESVFKQKYTNYNVYYVDDCSIDNTVSLVRAYIAKHNQEQRFSVLANQEHKGGIQNLYEIIHTLPNHDLVIELDGDDWFAHDHVLAKLNALYWEQPIWATYGQYKEYPSGVLGGAHEYDDYVVAHKHYRRHPYFALHPHSFYAGFFKMVRVEDLMYEGKFLEMTWDQAFNYPMLEMAGRHMIQGPEVFYIYNRANPLNDDRISRSRQVQFERIVRSRPIYATLDPSVMEPIIKESERCAK